jgi:hypothetical protein
MSFAKTSRQQQFASGGTCLGCLYRRGSGSNAWCVNPALSPEQRPFQAGDMRGCAQFKLSGNGDGMREASMAKCLGRIAMRRAVRR